MACSTNSDRVSNDDRRQKRSRVSSLAFSDSGDEEFVDFKSILSAQRKENMELMKVAMQEQAEMRKTAMLMMQPVQPFAPDLEKYKHEAQVERDRIHQETTSSTLSFHAALAKIDQGVRQDTNNHLLAMERLRFEADKIAAEKKQAMSTELNMLMENKKLETQLKLEQMRHEMDLKKEQLKFEHELKLKELLLRTTQQC
jgi:hypothetical protein